CAFCQLNDECPEKYGEKKTYEAEKLTLHYYCLLMSSGIWQRGEEDEGIYGFLLEDIRKELKRARKLVCKVCRKKGASIGCSGKRCKKSYHFPCGVQKECIFQFTGEFRSYCWDHRPIQKHFTEGRPSEPSLCTICFEYVEPIASYNIIKSPCCKNSWFHRDCLQHQALSAGMFFFRCTICNNKEKFQQEMLRLGIYIPERDASWELEEDAYQELFQRYQHCDVTRCHCKMGREYNRPNSYLELLSLDCCISNTSRDNWKIISNFLACITFKEQKPTLKTNTFLNLSHLSLILSVLHFLRFLFSLHLSPSFSVVSLCCFHRSWLKRQRGECWRSQEGQCCNKRGHEILPAGSLGLVRTVTMVGASEYILKPVCLFFCLFSKWEIRRCDCCGSRGTHLACSSLGWQQNWECVDCRSTMQESVIAHSQNWYYEAGRIIAISLVHGGPAPGFFSTTLFNCLVHGPDKAKPTIDDIADLDIAETILKIKAAKTLKELLTAVKSSSKYLLVAECLRPIQNMVDKEELVRDLLVYHVIGRVRSPFESFREGLKILGVLEKIQMYPDIFCGILCHGAEKLTAEVLGSLFKIHFSEEGTRKRMHEARVIGFWRDYLKDVEGNKTSRSLEEILIFATGADAIPPIGFVPEPSIEFWHSRERSPFPIGNKCKNTLKFPITKTYKEFKRNMDFAVSMEL
uniref:G2/M-phase specific E3 ubiquitin protein ligase n=1 Tax=Latimeria chalumnae TaxID=7897 RepID=H3AFB9_LATCH